MTRGPESVAVRLDALLRHLSRKLPSQLPRRWLATLREKLPREVGAFALTALLLLVIYAYVRRAAREL